MLDQQIKSEEIVEDYGVITLPLSNISNYLDYISLWKPRGGLSSRTIKSLFRQVYLLHRALGDYTYQDVENKHGSIYSSVILKIPQENYNKILLAGKLYWLAQELAKTHYKDLKDELLNGRYPSYMIVPDKNMEAGKAEFLFGDMVFVPNQDDQLIFSIEYGEESSDSKLHPVQWHYPGFSTPIPAGLYTNQPKGICIGLHPSPFEINSATWGERSYSHIRIIPENGNPDRLLIFTDLDLVDTLEMEGRNEVKLKIAPKISNAADASEIPSSLVLKFKRVVPYSKNVAILEEKEGKGGKNNSASINVAKEDHTFARTARVKPKPDLDLTFRYGKPGTAKVKLEGFLLPRLDKTALSFEGKDLASWVLWFNGQGGPYNKKPVSDPELTLSANNKEGVLFFKQGGDKTFTRLVDGYHMSDVRILSPPNDLDDEFLAMLEIPIQTKSFLLQSGIKKVCGRSSEVDFNLNLFNDVESCLKFKDGTSDSNWDRMLTSSRHIEFELLDNGSLQVTQISKSIPVYILDRENQLLEELPRIHDNIPGKSAKVDDGQKIVVGSYLLKFIGGKLRKTEKSASVNRPEQDKKEDKQETVLEPIVALFTMLLHSYLQWRGQKDYKPELRPMTYVLLNIINNLDEKGDDSGCMEDLKNACHSIRVTANRWAHQTVEPGFDETVLENTLSLKRSLVIFKKNLFPDDFQEDQKATIDKLEQAIEKTKNIFCSRVRA
ncbi:MAG: hypothetical protein MUO63_01670 [Desulfobulbaceae bacterium]|nr:hypothetical protein [Desulfobulbaceae bacterium]